MAVEDFCDDLKRVQICYIMLYYLCPRHTFNILTFFKLSNLKIEKFQNSWGPFTSKIDSHVLKCVFKF